MTPAMIADARFANALNFIIATLDDDPEFPLSLAANIDPYSLDEFAEMHDFDAFSYNNAIRTLKKIRAQLDY